MDIYLIMNKFVLQQAQKEIVKMRESEEKQRRAKEAREKAEVEKAARAERKRALVDMNAHETQEGVMDSLMEALQTGSAFSRPDQRRKRQTRVAGGKFKLVRNINSNSVTIVRRKSSLVHRNYTRKQSNSDAATNEDYSTPVENMNFIKEFMLREAMKTPKKDKFSYKSRIEIANNFENEAFCTPEENQSRIKDILMSNAEKAPKKNDAFYKVSRIFKNRTNSDDYCMSDGLDETPRRAFSISVSSSKLHDYDKIHALETPSPRNYLSTVPRNFCQKTSYDSVIKELKNSMPEYSNDENLKESTDSKEFYGKTPFRKMFIAGKKKKRNSFIRRTIINRRRNSQKHKKSFKSSDNSHYQNDDIKVVSLDENENFFTLMESQNRVCNYSNHDSESKEISPPVSSNSKYTRKLSPFANHYRGSITLQSSDEKKKTWNLWKKLGNSAKSVKRKYNIKQTESEIGK